MVRSIKWLSYSFISIIIIILAISIFNYKTDSLGIFGNSNYLSKAARTLTNGQMISGLRNYDERLFQELIIKNLHVKNDVIAIGSSRTMQLRKRFFVDKETNYFNHSVSGASIEDYISIIGAYELIGGYLPSTIVLGIDPWIFNENNAQTRWKTLIKYYNYEIQKIYNKENLKVDNLNITKWKQLFNYDYTVSNIKFFKSYIENSNNQFKVVNTIETDDSIKEADGSIHYPYKTRNISSLEVQKLAISYTKGEVYSLERFTHLSNTELLESLIKYLKSKNIKIILFLPPYNPLSYDIIIKNKKYKFIDIAEDYLISLATKNDLEIKGSYNPNKYKLLNKDFTDGMHSRASVVRNLFK